MQAGGHRFDPGTLHRSTKRFVVCHRLRRAGLVSGLVSRRDERILSRLQESLGESALGDVRKAAEGGATVGAFILGANFVDVLARLSATKNDGKAAWDEFVRSYLPRFAASAELLYRGFRGALSHHYSADGIRLVDGDINRLRHWTEEDGERVLHLESFIEDLTEAWRKLYADVQQDQVLQQRLLARARLKPPIAVLGGEPVEASVSLAPGFNISVAGYNPTHFGAPTPSGGVSQEDADSGKTSNHGK